MKPQKRRAVAPIIATLLMVAIAVVGGMMVFVFAQGFFEDTQISSPTLEQLEIFGYNATDRTGGELQTHAGVTITGLDGGVNNRLGDGEEFFVFLRNLSGSDVLISELTLYGVIIEPDTQSAGTSIGPIGTTTDGGARWALSTDGREFCGCQILAPGQEGTLVISYEDSINGEVQIGRPMIMSLETGGGTKFTKQIITGRDIG